MDDKDKVKMLEFYFLQLNMIKNINCNLEKQIQEFINDDETKQKICKKIKINCELIIHLKNLYKDFIFDS